MEMEMVSQLIDQFGMDVMRFCPEADLLQRGRPRPVSADLLKIDGTSGCHPERGESAGLSVQHCKRHLEK